MNVVIVSIPRIRNASMPPLVRKASPVAFLEITVNPAEDQRSERLVSAWRRSGPGTSGHCGIPASRIRVSILGRQITSGPIDIF